MACATFASAQANNHSKTTQYLPAQRNCATTTTPFARVSTLVYKMISHHVPSPMRASRCSKFPNGSHTHHEGFSGKPLHWPTDKNHSPLITHHGHVTETSNRALPKSKPRPSTCQQESPHLGRFRQGEPAGSRVPRPPAANEVLPKRRACVRCQWQKCKNGVRPEAHVPPNSVHRRKCVRTALHTALGSTRLNALDSERVQTPSERPSRNSISNAQV